MPKLESGGTLALSPLHLGLGNNGKHGRNVILKTARSFPDATRNNATRNTTGGHELLTRSVTPPTLSVSRMARSLRPRAQRNVEESKPTEIGTENQNAATSRSTSWSSKDDETLIQARAEGLNWNQIAPKHFPSKSPNACRKRHERLIERLNAESWDGIKFDVLAQAYMDVRREMWGILASRVGEKWTLVEAKCMEKGLRNLNQAYRSAHKKQGEYDNNFTDSAIGLESVLEETDERAPSYVLSNIPDTQSQYDTAHSLHQRVPSIRSVLQKFERQQERIRSPDTWEHHPVPNNRPSLASTKELASSQPMAEQRMPRIEHMSDKNLQLEAAPSSISRKARNNITEEHHPATSQSEVHVPNCSSGRGDRLAESPIEALPNDHTGHLMGDTALESHPVDEPRPSSVSQAPSPSEHDSNESMTSSDAPTSCWESPGSSSTQSIDASRDSHKELRSQKQEIVDRLMIRFHEIFAPSGYRCRNGHTSSTSENVSTSGVPVTPRSSMGTGSKRRHDEGGNEDGENGEDRSRKRARKISEKTMDELGSITLLACPYFKHDPTKYKASRTCVGPGWDTVSRLKQHLYRRHMLPIHCLRCFRLFESGIQLAEHSRDPEPCTIQDAEQCGVDGMDKNTEKKLKCRKNMYRAESEEDKWRIIYLILFPDTALTTLPSPYYDEQSYQEPLSKNNSKPTDLEQFEAFMNRELPRSVRKALETAIETLVGPIEETLKNELEKIVRECQESLTRSYSGGACSSTPTSLRTTVTKNAAQAPSPFFVPPDLSPDLWNLPEFMVSPANLITDTQWTSGPTDVGQNGSSGSGYFSDTMPANDVLFGDK